LEGYPTLNLRPVNKLICIAALLLSGSLYPKVPTIVAHRGASHDAPENTLPAFKLAWERGADAIEGDFYLTKDGHVVCIHDKDTKRVAGTKLLVGDSTLAELRKLDVGAWKDPAYKGTAIPTIAEVLATIPPRKRMFIEIKCGSEIIPALLEQIGRSGLQADQIVVICFNAQVLQELKAMSPGLKVSWLSGFKTDKATGEITPSLDQVLQTLGRIGADGFSSNAGIPESYVEPIKANGYEWHVWTVNDLSLANRMKGLGVQSITTDRPGFLKKEMAQ
jgi:glycerophosphoryl diester phosphodiesterase